MPASPSADALTTILPYETWMPVVGFEGLYVVSDKGRVRGIERMVERIGLPMRIPARELTQHKNSFRGAPVRYVYVNLSRSGRFPKRVSRLVLEAFVGPCPTGRECCHNDGDVFNNRLENLRWDTHAENVLDIKRHGHSVSPHNPAKGAAHGQSKFTEDDIRCIRAEPDFHGVGTMLARAFGVTRGAIYHVRAGQVWNHI